MNRRHAFTLVELLVVVAIIALLIGILLPSVNRAREVAQSAVCLTNLRGIQSALNMYANENREVIAPSWRQGSRLGYDFDRDVIYPGLLVDNDYLSAQMYEEGELDAGDAVDEGIFNCPTALAEAGGWSSTNGPPADRSNDKWDDGLAANLGYTNTDGDELVLFSHYGLNGSNSAPEYPSVWVDSTFAGEVEGRWRGFWRLNELQSPTQQVGTYDGRAFHQGGMNRIIARHGGDATRINISFFDGHAETVDMFNGSGDIQLFDIANAPSGFPSSPSNHLTVYKAMMRGVPTAPLAPYFFVYEQGTTRYPN